MKLSLPPLLLLLIPFNTIESKISLDLTTRSWFSYDGSYDGEEIIPVTDEDITTFFNGPLLYDAVQMYHGRRPSDVYYRPPTPWGDLYSSYGWAPVTKKIKVEYMNLKNAYNQQTVVLKQDFDNPSSHAIRVNTGLSRTIHNTVTTSWWQSSSTTETSGFYINIKFLFMGTSAHSQFSTTTAWGKSEVRSESITVGTTQGVETELKPGQSVTAELSTTTRYLEYEVGYKTYLRGKLAVNYHPTHRGHHFYGLSVKRVLKAAGIYNLKRVKQTIKVAYNIDAKLKVTDKATGVYL